MFLYISTYFICSADRNYIAEDFGE